MKTKIFTASLTAIPLGIALLTSLTSAISPASAEVYLASSQATTNNFDYPIRYL
ncbi:hypothetical protein [Brunnivagina elsteri]|uniref:hypothetical protein n=1 Tax=Brunnivagina elsteri TaxID=1247191 RepID=UPI0013040908|nr:hypothetical protein [Calothrix elsteri]